MSVDILGTSWDQRVSMVHYSFTSTETMRLVRTDSPGRPPRLSHSSWTIKSFVGHFPHLQLVEHHTYTHFKKCTLLYISTTHRLYNKQNEWCCTSTETIRHWGMGGGVQVEMNSSSKCFGPQRRKRPPATARTTDAVSAKQLVDFANCCSSQQLCRTKSVSEKQLLKPEVKDCPTPYESPAPPPSSGSGLGVEDMEVVLMISYKGAESLFAWVVLSRSK